MGAVKMEPEKRDIVIFVSFVPVCVLYRQSNEEDTFVRGGAPSIPIAWIQ
jgi:hypothetical protein